MLSLSLKILEVLAITMAPRNFLLLATKLTQSTCLQARLVGPTTFNCDD